MRVFLRSDPRLYKLSELKEKANELQTLGEFLLEEFTYQNEARVGFFIKRTSDHFQALGCVEFPFRNCSGDRANCTNGYGPQKHYYSSKDEDLRLVIDEYYVGPKKKSEATSAFSLLAIVPARSKKNGRKERQTLLAIQSSSIGSPVASPAFESAAHPQQPDSPSFVPSQVVSDADFDPDMFVENWKQCMLAL